MTDIVERLRALEACETELAHDGDCPPEATANWKYAETCRLAAAEIERLRAALRFYACPVGGDTFPQWSDGYPGGVLADENTIDCGEVARAALGEKP